VPLTVLQAFSGGDFNPPDMLLLAPGMLERGDGLLAFSPGAAIYENLRDAGEGYASAVALGGYGWALNRAHLSEAPLDWSALGDGPKEKKESRAFAGWTRRRTNPLFLFLCVSFADGGAGDF
jgi:hypothetical protein